MSGFYIYRIAQRPAFNPLLFAGRLFQQFAYTYRGFSNFVASEAHSQNITPRRVFVLPSTFIGGPRHMNELYMDVMAICRRFGALDLFVT